MKRGLTHCLQLFPTPDLNKTAAYYTNLGFRAEYYLQSLEPHVCLYRDAIEIVLTKSNTDKIIPNRIAHGYGYDAYLITNAPDELENEFQELGIRIVRPLIRTDYNNIEFVFEDIDGRWLAVGNKVE
ncbi:VOC family protein [Paenibacillus sp. strain BS8-2]